MNKERYFQYLQGPNQGKIVKFKGVNTDDPDMTRIEFNDGEMCNIAMIGRLNDDKAFSNGMYMAEIYDKDNPWKFEDKSIKDDVRYGQLKNGSVVEGWDPYVHGRFGNLDRSKHRIVGIPPKHIITKQEFEESAQQLESFGMSKEDPNFIQGIKNIVKNKNTVIASPGTHKVTDLTNGYKHMSSDGKYEIDIQGENGTIIDPISATAPTQSDIDRFELNKNSGVYVPNDILKKESPSNNVENVEYQEANTNTTNIEVEKPKINTTTEIKQETSTVNTINIENTNTIDSNISKLQKSPIYNMVSGCKKKDVKAPLILDLKLPGKSVYQMIKENFDDSCVEDFFDIIISDISTKQIKDALKEALKSSYEGNQASAE